MHAIEHEFALLIVHGGAHRDDAGRPLRHKLGDRQRRIKRVAGINGFEEFRADLDEADQLLADDMRKQPAPAAVKLNTWSPCASGAGWPSALQYSAS